MLLVLSPTAQGAENYDALFRRHAEAHGLDWRLVKAIATVESHLNPRAENRRDPSLGLMGVLCRPAGASCGNRFDIAGWPPARREQLFEPEYNVAIGTQVLAWNIRTYGLERGIATYNAWSARLTPRGKSFPNQYYVDKVLRTYQAQRGTPPAGGVANNPRSTSRLKPVHLPPVIVPPRPRDGLHPRQE